MRPRGLNMAIRRYHRRSDWSEDHNDRYFSSWNGLTVKKSASKSSAVSAQERGILYWPACWVAYKRKSGRAQSLVCSLWSTPPHPSWTQPELHHLDTVCWISKFPIVPHSLGSLWSTGARPFPSIKQTWARPSQEGVPLSINQANLSAPFPIYQSVCQELRMDGGIANPDQLGGSERGLTHSQQRLFLACLARNSDAEGDV